MSAISVLQTPPSSPQRFEEDDTTSNESHQKTNDAQQDKIEAPETLPPTPRYECDDGELHATENDTSTTDDAADHQADPPLGRTEELKAPHADAEVDGFEVSLTPPSTLPTHGGKEGKTEDVVSAVGTGKAQDERTIIKKNEDDPYSTVVIADHTTPMDDTKASLSSEPFEQSEKDEQKETDHVTSAVETTDSSSEEPEQVEGAKVEIPASKAEAKEPPVSSPAKVTQSIVSTLVQQQPVQLIRVITPGYHPESNRTVFLETALAVHPKYLCRGVTKAMTLCKNPAHSCGHPGHRGEREITKGDVFREYLSTLILTRASKKLHFITERDANIELVKGSAGPVGFFLRHQLVSQDLYPTTARPEVHTKVRACIDSFVQKAKEITSSYGEYIKLSIFHAIYQHLIGLNNAKRFPRDDEKTLRPFATGYVYFTIYTPGSFLYYDKDFIANHCVVIKNGVSRNVNDRFKGQDGHEKRCGIDPKNRRSFPDETNPNGVLFAWLLESILHCCSRAHQFTFQCNRPTCNTRHEEMFLYKLLPGENQVEALHDVVDHLVRKIKIEDWIQALCILKPLQEFFEKLVV